MSISRKLSAGAIALVSVAGLSAAAAPASAEAPSKGHGATKSFGPRCSSSWKNAVGIPFRWKKISDNTCAIIGSPGLKVGYQWTAERGRPCVKVKGTGSGGRVKWFNAGCGKTGSIKVFWGNVADKKEIKVKGASLFKWR